MVVDDSPNLVSSAALELAEGPDVPLFRETDVPQPSPAMLHKKLSVVGAIRETATHIGVHLLQKRNTAYTPTEVEQNMKS